MVLRPLSLALASGFAAIPFAAQTSQPIPFDAAQRDFAEAKALCQADAGKLWGVSLCGPILFVDPDSRTLVANSPTRRARSPRKAVSTWAYSRRAKTSPTLPPTGPAHTGPK